MEVQQSSPAEDAVRLVLDCRWAALATTSEQGPLGTMVSYAVEPGFEGILMFLSGLSRHTRNLDAAPVASLAVSLPDHGDLPDPQTLPRVSVQGRVEAIPRDDPRFAEAWRVYAGRLPASAPRLVLGDFNLYRLVPDEARFVGGFGAARTLRGDSLRDAAHRLGG